MTFGAFIKKHDKLGKMTQTGRSDDINGCREIELSKPLKKKARVSIVKEMLIFHGK